MSRTDKIVAAVCVLTVVTSIALSYMVSSFVADAAREISTHGLKGVAERVWYGGAHK